MKEIKIVRRRAMLKEFCESMRPLVAEGASPFQIRIDDGHGNISFRDLNEENLVAALRML